MLSTHESAYKNHSQLFAHIGGSHRPCICIGWEKARREGGGLKEGMCKVCMSSMIRGGMQ